MCFMQKYTYIPNTALKLDVTVTITINKCKYMPVTAVQELGVIRCMTLKLMNSNLPQPYTLGTTDSSSLALVNVVMIPGSVVAEGTGVDGARRS
jgi:hypothetical protein